VATAYEVTVVPADGWLMVSVPALDLLTQARDEAEIETMARSVIAAMLDVPRDSFDVHITEEATG